MSETFYTANFGPTKLKWWLKGAVLSSGQPVSGPITVAEMSLGGWWACQTTVRRLSTKLDVQRWDSLMARLGLGTQSIIVPFVAATQPWLAGTPQGDTGSPFSDFATFSDGALFASDLLDYALGAPAALRATSVTIVRSKGADLLGGEHFTLTGALYGERLYRIGRLTAASGDSFTANVTPPLREAYDAGTSADFANPRCTMKLAADKAEDAFLEVERPYRGQPEIVFEETFA